MRNKITDLINMNEIKFIVFEDCFNGLSNTVFQGLCQFQGFLISNFIDLDIGFHIVKPSAWRSPCGIKGRKREEQKQNAINFVKNKYGIEAPEDVAESICIATYAMTLIDIK